MNALLDIDRKDYDAIGAESAEDEAGYTAGTVKEPPAVYEAKKKGEKTGLRDVKAIAASRKKRSIHTFVNQRAAYGRE